MAPKLLLINKNKMHLQKIKLSRLLQKERSKPFEGEFKGEVSKRQ